MEDISFWREDLLIDDGSDIFAQARNNESNGLLLLERNISSPCLGAFVVLVTSLRAGFRLLDGFGFGFVFGGRRGGLGV